MSTSRTSSPSTPAHRFATEQFIPSPLETVFAFFSDATNLERLTPPWLRFNMVTPTPIEMAPGALIDYKLSIRGVRVSWRTEIVDWQPNRRFVDVQLRGPYKSWVHTHVFEAQEGGTSIRDEIEYQMPFGILGSIVNRFVVARDLERIFAYRQQQTTRFFATPVNSDT
jgi:ligand-binding SRPBCC domain-containing protein